MAVCCTCKVEKGCFLHSKAKKETEKDAYRCPECAKTLKCLKAVFDADNELREDWKSFSKSKKEAFMAENHALQGTALKMAVSDVIIRDYMEQHGTQHLNGGGWVDEKTLKDNYKHDPAQAENIMKNTKSFYCNIKERTLYLDVTYETYSEYMEEVLKKRRLETRQDEDVKKAKKPKNGEGNRGGQ